MIPNDRETRSVYKLKSELIAKEMDRKMEESNNIHKIMSGTIVDPPRSEEVLDVNKSDMQQIESAYRVTKGAKMVGKKKEDEQGDMLLPDTTDKNMMESVLVPKDYEISEEADKNLFYYMAERQFYMDGFENKPPRVQAEITECRIDKKSEKISIKATTETGRVISKKLTLPHMNCDAKENYFLRILEHTGISAYETDKLLGETVPIKATESGDELRIDFTAMKPESGNKDKTEKEFTSKWSYPTIPSYVGYIVTISLGVFVIVNTVAQFVTPVASVWVLYVMLLAVIDQWTT